MQRLPEFVLISYNRVFPVLQLEETAEQVA